MLKTRVVTAVVMLAVFLPSLFLLPLDYWAVLTALVAGVAGWEWGGLARLGAGARIACGLAVTGLCLLLQFFAPSLVAGEAGGAVLIYGLASAFWATVVPPWLSRKWRLPGAGLGLLVGVVVIVPAWLALVQLRQPGPGALLAVLLAVWIADIAAYFSGKAFGRHKLAPAISPGKTWEGAVGAAVAVVAYGLAMRHFLAGEVASIGLWVVGLLAVTAISIVGDLFESLLKRQAGLKDSSNILPGHGGVLDRIDSLTSTLPAVTLLWLSFASSPA